MHNYFLFKKQESPSSSQSSIISLENGIQNYETRNDTPVTTKTVKVRSFDSLMYEIS